MLRSIPIVLLSFLVMPGSAQVTYEVRPAGIRPAGEDYAPSLMDSTLVFCSLRFADQVVRVEQADTEKPLSDLYSVPYASAATTTAVAMNALNTVLNDGPATFAADGTICFTRNTDDPGSISKIRRGTGGIGLFFAARAMDPTTGQVLAWTQARPFEYNSRTPSRSPEPFRRWPLAVLRLGSSRWAGWYGPLSLRAGRDRLGSSGEPRPFSEQRSE
ncbi:MAG: hypothetical protein IPI07_17525 [Flavobacteriales bacterium]|nr:hypothetical protein [Flavobacteriales bacterium]